MRPQKYPDKKIKRAKKLYLSGLSVPKISQKIQVPEQTIYHWKNDKWELTAKRKNKIEEIKEQLEKDVEKFTKKIEKDNKSKIEKQIEKDSEKLIEKIENNLPIKKPSDTAIAYSRQENLYEFFRDKALKITRTMLESTEIATNISRNALAEIYKDSIKKDQNGNTRFSENLKKTHLACHIMTKTIDAMVTLMPTNSEEMSELILDELAKINDDVIDCEIKEIEI